MYICTYSHIQGQMTKDSHVLVIETTSHCNGQTLDLQFWSPVPTGQTAWLIVSRKLTSTLTISRTRLINQGSLHTTLPSTSLTYSCQGLRPTSESGYLFYIQLVSPAYLDRHHIWSSFQSLLDRPDFTWVSWAKFQVCLEDTLQVNPVTDDEEAIEKYVEKQTRATQEATAAPSVKRRPRADPRLSQPAIWMIKYAWRTNPGGTLRAQTNRLLGSVTYQLNEMKNKQWSHTLGSLDGEDQSPWKATKMTLRFPSTLL
jgi:hypothetical protein